MEQYLISHINCGYYCGKNLRASKQQLELLFNLGSDVSYDLRKGTNLTGWGEAATNPFTHGETKARKLDIKYQSSQSENASDSVRTFYSGGERPFIDERWRVV